MLKRELRFVLFFVTFNLQLSLLVNVVQSYKIPKPTIEALRPRGLRVSIPDASGVALFAFNGNINKKINSGGGGEISGEVYRKKNGRWIFEDSSVSVRGSDVLHYWLYVQVNGRSYNTNEQTWELAENTEDEEENQTPPDKKTTGSKLILDENFDSLNTSLWRREVIIPSIPDYEFCVFHNRYNVRNLEVRDGILRIKPTILDDSYGENATIFGRLQLSECTSNIPAECSRQAASFSILPPVISARLTTKNRFNFRYGKIEIRAKFPQGDWLYPEMWLMPRYSAYGPDYLSGRVLLGLSRGNEYLASTEDISDIYDGRKLEFGIRSGAMLDVREETISRLYDGNSRWTEDFHVYTTIWTSGGFIFSVDNEEIGRLSPGPNGWLHNSTVKAASDISPFDQEFYISIGVGVGGVRVFPDRMMSSGYPKPWKNTGAKAMLNFWHAKDRWQPSWSIENGKKTAFEIDYIRVWSI